MTTKKEQKRYAVPFDKINYLPIRMKKGTAYLFATCVVKIKESFILTKEVL